PPRRLQRGSRVAYLEWIGEVKQAKRLGKRVGRGPPPSRPRPTDVSATPPATPTPSTPSSRPHANAGFVALPPTHGRGASSMPAHQPHGGVRFGRSRKAVVVTAITAARNPAHPVGNRGSSARENAPLGRYAASRPALRASAGSSASRRARRPASDTVRAS